jgi:hypothetical protein
MDADTTGDDALQADDQEQLNRKLGGYKATLTSTFLYLVIPICIGYWLIVSSPPPSDERTSEEAKKHAAEVLQSAGVDIGGRSSY